MHDVLFDNIFLMQQLTFGAYTACFHVHMSIWLVNFFNCNLCILLINIMKSYKQCRIILIYTCIFFS